jgi:LEA14-like dessication related protein
MPTLTPYSVQVVSVDPMGMGLRTEFDVYNPNRLALTVQGVSGTVVIDQRIFLGQTSVPTATRLPGRSTQRVVASVVVPWTALPDLMSLAQGRASLPYTFEGRARIGGRSLNVEIPFALRGEVTAQQLLSASVRGLPILPGFPPAN